MASAITGGSPICSEEECSPFDIGIVYKAIAGFTNAEKYKFIENV